MKVSQSTRPTIDAKHCFSRFLRVKPLFSESTNSATPRQTAVPVDKNEAFEWQSIVCRRAIYRKYAYEFSFSISVQAVKGAQTTALTMKMRFLGCTSGKPFRKQNDDLPSAGIRFRRHCANYCFGMELHSGRQVRRFGHFSGRSCRGLPATCRLTLADRCVVSGHFDVLILSCVYHDVRKTTVGTSKVPPTCSSRHPVWGSKKWRNIRTCRPKCVCGG